ncbi:addiction module protein [Candidatus Lokiarchaeum ossiferum]|uniref:addiction module protein n=1 Tax=Candidatus Lokiarchaeum ossiferum TaxID=2951803 RepID=UPI00352CEDA2
METLEDLEKKASQLPKKDRAILVRNLIRTLENFEDERDYTNLWIEEAERRSKEIEDRKVECIPAEKVFNDLKRRYQ